MASQFGGVPIEEKKSQFGGIPQSDWQPLKKSIEETKKPGYIETVMQSDLGKSMENAPESALNFAKGMVRPITHPVETMKGLADTSFALAEKMAAAQIESYSRLFGDGDDVETPKFDELTRHYRERYGTGEGMKNAIETDPVGVLADGLATVFAGKAGIKSVKNAVGSLPESVPIGMYEEVAKITNTKEFRNPEKRRAVIKAWLEEGIPFTEKGVKKMDKIIESINEEITTLVNASPDKKIPRQMVLANIPELRAKLEGKFGATEDLAMVDRAVNSYIKTIERSGGGSMTIKELNDFKKDAWKKVTDWSPAKPNTQKLEDKIYQNVGGTAGEIVGELVPGVGPLNQRQAPLLAGREQLMNATNRINKHNKVLNMSALIGTGSGELIGSMMGMPGIGTAVGAGAYLLGKPGAKAPLARALYNSRSNRDLTKPELDLIKAYAATYGANNENTP